MSAPVTPARAALHDLIATMQAIENAYEKSRVRSLSEVEDAQLAKLEDRRSALERQLQAMVQEQMGIDYAVLWHAVTPTGPVPKLPG
jgi:hypothetical protein